MRRSSKASQLISQSGQQETYKFRCMQYLNFVLDQMVNQENRFKLYSSHIEHLMRRNLNDITIQDIEKIKRMLEEGEKQKVQTQQTGQFINYQLIDKLRYSHQQSYYYFHQAPQQSLRDMYDPNSLYVLEEVQEMKERHRQQRLLQENYKMLDLMFKLPEEQDPDLQIYNQENQEIERQPEIQNQSLEEEQFEKIGGNQNNYNYGQEQKLQIIGREKFIDINQSKRQKGQISKLVGRQVQNGRENVVTQNKNRTVQKDGQIAKDILLNKTQKQQFIRVNNSQSNNKLPPQLLTNKNSQAAQIEMNFVEIKKKKSTKKKNTNTDNVTPQKPSIEQQINDPNKMHPQIQINALPSKKELENNEQNGILVVVEPQKRKYIRKKPFQPKPKIKKVKQSNLIIGESKQAVDNNEINLLENNSQLKDDNKQQGQKNAVVNIVNVGEKQKKAKKPRKSPLKTSTVTTSILNNPFIQQSTVINTNKISGQLPICQHKINNNQNKQHQEMQLEIMLPYPQCGKEVQELKRQIEELNRKLQEEKIQFQKNNLHMELMFSKVKSANGEINNSSAIEKLQNASPYNLTGREGQQHHNPLSMMPPISTQQPNQLLQTKKPKSSAKLNVLKKQSKKSSSQSYKPAQDQLESISQIQNEGKLGLVEVDEEKMEKYTKAQLLQLQLQQQKRKYSKKAKGNNSKSSEQQQHQYSAISMQGSSNQKHQSSVNNSSQNPSVTEVNLSQLSHTNSYPNNPNSINSNNNESSQLLTTKEKKVKLTQQQRDRLKLEKEKLREMKLKEKEEKRMLKQLEKQQKDLGKIKQPKDVVKIKQPKGKKVAINVNNNKVEEGIIVNSERNPIQKQAKVNDLSAVVVAEVNASMTTTPQLQKHLQPQKQQNNQTMHNMHSGNLKQNNLLEESIGNNSTKEDISLISIRQQQKGLLAKGSRNDGNLQQKQLEIQFVCIKGKQVQRLQQQLSNNQQQQQQMHSGDMMKRHKQFLAESIKQNNSLHNQRFIQQQQNGQPTKRVKLNQQQQSQSHQPKICQDLPQLPEAIQIQQPQIFNNNNQH